MPSYLQVLQILLFPSYHNSNIKQSLLLCQQKIFDALELKLGMLDYEELLTEVYTLPPPDRCVSCLPIIC